MDSEYAKSFEESVKQVAALLDGDVDYNASGLGEWNLRGLVGHYLRAVRTPINYLAGPEPEAAELPDAPSYLAAYLDARDRDPRALDATVAARGSVELEQESESPAMLLRNEASRLYSLLSATPPDRLVSSPFGAIPLGEYMRTRTLEITIHGFDIARALGRRWRPPAAHLADCLVLLSEVAVIRGNAPGLLLLMTGRIAADKAEDALPVLR